jgi:hypothetical protein
MNIILKRSKKVENNILKKHKVTNSLNYLITGRSLKKKMKLSTKYQIETKKVRKIENEKLKMSKVQTVLKKSLK